jgi:myosin-5
VEKVDDAATFEETREALTKVGIDQEMQVLIFKLLATILHIGNIELKSNRQVCMREYPEIDIGV